MEIKLDIQPSSHIIPHTKYKFLSIYVRVITEDLREEMARYESVCAIHPASGTILLPLAEEIIITVREIIKSSFLSDNLKAKKG